jgi:hypothetical protein
MYNAIPVAVWNGMQDDTARFTQHADSKFKIQKTLASVLLEAKIRFLFHSSDGRPRIRNSKTQFTPETKSTEIQEPKFKPAQSTIA